MFNLHDRELTQEGNDMKETNSKAFFKMSQVLERKAASKNQKNTIL